MKKKTKGILATIVLAIVIVLYTSPILTIRGYLFLQGYPIVSLTADIHYTGKSDEGERVYRVETWTERGTETEIPNVYLKKNVIGMYYVEDGGVG